MNKPFQFRLGIFILASCLLHFCPYRFVYSYLKLLHFKNVNTLRILLTSVFRRVVKVLKNKKKKILKSIYYFVY